MKFLLQIIDSKIKHDHVFELERAIEYYQWKADNMSAEYCTLEDINDGCTFIDADEIRDYIPVGTLEFVYAFIDKFIKKDGSSELKPLNLPEELFPYANRKILNVSLDSKHIRESVYDSFYVSVYIKSNDRIKSEINGRYIPVVLLSDNLLPDGNYQISEYNHNIISEYRLFIYNDELKGIQYYSGSYTVFPDIEKIYDMLDCYKHNYGYGPAPIAYTLDIGITKFNEIIPIECHEFYSCGLYGFSDYNVLPYMFSKTWFNIKNRLLYANKS